MKITMTNLQSRLDALNAVLGTDYVLDNMEGYGGWQIVSKDESSCPFGYDRHKTAELYHMINFALRAVQIDRKGDEYAGYWPSDKQG